MRLLPNALVTSLVLSTAPARADETSARWMAAIPFGVGQFQNGNVGLGITFATGEALMGAASIASAVVTHKLASTRVNGPGPVNLTRLNESLRLSVTANQIAFSAWAALTVAGVIEAQVSLVPRRRDQTGPSVVATAAPVPGGGTLGVRAVF